MLSESPFTPSPTTLADALTQLGQLEPLNNELDPYSSLIDQDQDLLVADSPIARLDLQNTLDFTVDRVNVILELVTIGLGNAGGGGGAAITTPGTTTIGNVTT